MKFIEIKKTHPDAIIPRYQSHGAAAVDLHACTPNTAFRIRPGESEVIPVGISIYINDTGIVGKIYTRSGNGFKNGVILRNNVGIIDSDYTGEIMVCLLNTGFEEFELKHGDRIAQMVFTKIEQVTWLEVTEFSHNTERGSKGFGSTGK